MVYVNDLQLALKVNVSYLLMTFFLFSVAHDVNTFANDINKDLKPISDWAFQWKMSFNPDPSKQAQAIIFSRKIIF